MAITQLVEITKKIREHVLVMAHESKSAHTGPALSCVEILVALYFELMRPEDRFIMSKGHGCMSYYAVLAEKDIIPKEWLKTYSINGGKLAEHPSNEIPGVHIHTGSLGHGLSIAAGAALARKRKKLPGYEIVLLGDGECNEGSVWEAAMFAAHHQLDNLCVIIDNNMYQAIDKCNNVMSTSLIDGWRGFGWEAYGLNGHDIHAFVDMFEHATFRMYSPRKPLIFIMNTIKGKGVSFMEGNLEWHYRHPNKEELQKALEEVRRA